MNNMDSGIHIRMVGDEVFELCYWNNTKDFEQLDKDNIGRDNKYYYKMIINKLINKFFSRDLIIAGVGVETVIQYKNNIQDIIDFSKNVALWIIPFYEDVKVNSNYQIMRRKKFYLYSLS